MPHYAAAVGHGTVCRRAARRRRRTRPVRRRGRGGARRRRLRAARARRRSRRPRRRSTTGASTTATSTRRSPGRTSWCARRSVCRASRACRSSATASSATGTRPAGGSPRGRTSRGRSRSTGSPPRRSACAATGSGSSRRRTRAGRSASRPRSCRTWCSSASPSRVLGVPVRWTEDRLEHLAASSASTGRLTEIEAGFTDDGELVALRYDAIEDVGAYVRAPEPATLYRMHGSLSGAYRVRNVAARNRVVLTNTIPSGLNRGFGGPQLYFGLERTMAIAARRLGLDPADLVRRNLVAAADMPYRTPSGALYDSGDYAACLDRALELSGYDDLRARARDRESGGTARRRRPRLRRRAVDLEHGVHHAGADRRGARRDAAEVGERRGGLGRDRPARRDHRPARDDAAGPGPPHGVRPGRRRRARLRPRGRHRPLRARHRDDALDGRVRQLLVAVLRRRRRCGAGRGAEGAREGRRDPRPRRRPGRVRCDASPGRRTGARRAFPTAWSPVSPRSRSTRRRTSTRRMPRTGWRRPAPTAWSSTSAPSRSTAATGAVTVTDYVSVHDAGALLNPLLADGQVLGGFAHGVGAALFERHVYDDDGNLMTASLVDYLSPTAPDIPALRIDHLVSPSPFTALGAKGLGEGTTMSAPVAIANAVADALGRDDVELPLTAPRVWELIHGAEGDVKPAPFDYVRAESLGEALAALAEGGDDAKPIAGGQSLVPALNMRLVRPSLLVDLNRAGLDGIDANGAVRIGATTRQAALDGDERVHPLVRAALPFVGHFVTRNRGTVGGSIAHADGAAELPRLPRRARRARRGRRAGRTAGDPGRRVLRHALPHDAPSRRARRRDRLADRRAGRGERLRGARAPGGRLRPVDGRRRAPARRGRDRDPCLRDGRCGDRPPGPAGRGRGAARAARPGARRPPMQGRSRRGSSTRRARSMRARATCGS